MESRTGVGNLAIAAAGTPSGYHVMNVGSQCVDMARAFPAVGQPSLERDLDRG
jgi:hypothetical protein